jgi:hypothetical protein
MGLEPTTFCMASRRSTTELRPPGKFKRDWLKLAKSGKSVNMTTARMMPPDGVPGEIRAFPSGLSPDCLSGAYLVST